MNITILPARAVAAYTKGLAELDAVLPKLLAVAKVIDDESAAKADAEKAADSVVLSAYFRALPEYEEKEKAYRAWERDTAWFKPAAPERLPKPECPSWVSAYSGAIFKSYHCTHRVDELKSMRHALQNNLLMASVALPPYEMSPCVAIDMAKWENGMNVQELISRYKETS